MDTLEIEKLNVRLTVEATRKIPNSVVFKLILQKSTEKINEFSLGFGKWITEKPTSAITFAQKLANIKISELTGTQIV